MCSGIWIVTTWPVAQVWEFAESVMLTVTLCPSIALT
jgi:hypothetical protein